MKDQKIWLWAAIDAVVVFLYVMGVAFLMTNGDRIFGEMNNLWGPVTFLLLFVFSALVCGLLVFGRPVYLFLNNLKKEAVKMLLYTAAGLCLITMIALLLNVVLK